MDTMTPSDPSGSDLCLACGLCCAGVLHPHALLSAEEIDQAGRLGLKPLVREGGHVFSLPCPLYHGTGCPTYLDRPAVCRTHQCELLASYLDGTVGLAECLAAVDGIKALVLTIQGRLGATDPAKRVWLQAEEYRDGRGEDEVKFQQTHPELVRELATLKTICRRHFNPREVKKDEPTSSTPV